MNATSRVNRPTAMSAPPMPSIQAAATRMVGGGSGAPGCGTGKWSSFASPCSMNSRAVMMRRTARSCGSNRSRCRKSIERSPPVVSELTGWRLQPPEGSSVFPGLRFLAPVSGVLGEQLTRAIDHVDPVMEGVRKTGNKLLQRAFLQASGLVETVVADVAQIGLGLLHDRHVEEDASLADLVVGPEPADAPWRSSDDRGRLLIEDALAIRPRADVDRILEHAGNSAVIFGAAEQNAVGIGDLLAEPHPLLGRAGVEVLVVKR